jgi:hypothetical protein
VRGRIRPAGKIWNDWKGAAFVNDLNRWNVCNDWNHDPRLNRRQALNSGNALNDLNGAQELNVCSYWKGLSIELDA